GTVGQAVPAAASLLSLAAAVSAAVGVELTQFIIRGQSETAVSPEPKRGSVKEEDAFMTPTRESAVTRAFPLTTFPRLPPDCRGHSSRGGRRAYQSAKPMECS